jgi:hypothetical protein
VLEAIFWDALEEDFETISYARALEARAVRRFGARRARAMLVERSDILRCWRFRDCRLIPDAFLIDTGHRTIVSYEVEDARPLKRGSVARYTDAWWALKYATWDLRLFAYDIYGHPREIRFPQADLYLDRVELHDETGQRRRPT